MNTLSKKLKKELNKIITNPDDENRKNEENVFNEAMEVFHTFDTTFVEFLSIQITKLNEEKDFAKCLDLIELKLLYFHQHLQAYDMNIGEHAIEAAKFCSNLGNYKSATFRGKSSLESWGTTFLPD